MGTNLFIDSHTHTAMDLSMDGYYLFMDRQILSLSRIVYQVVQSMNWYYFVPVRLVAKNGCPSTKWHFPCLSITEKSTEHVWDTQKRTHTFSGTSLCMGQT